MHGYNGRVIVSMVEHSVTGTNYCKALTIILQKEAAVIADYRFKKGVSQFVNQFLKRKMLQKM